MQRRLCAIYLPCCGVLWWMFYQLQSNMLWQQALFQGRIVIHLTGC